jgi:hypothetical protein
MARPRDIILLPRRDTLALTRLLVLTVGPPVLVGALYALSFPSQFRGDAPRRPHPQSEDAASARLRGKDAEMLRLACSSAADKLLPHLPPRCQALVRPPFLLAGDLSIDELDGLYREAVLPVAAALWRSFFDHKPDQPVTIVVFGSETSYHAAAASLDGYEPLAYAGYTQRGKRRIVVNLATGRGTLAHELAHVLASFDFPEMPEWFDEGLAALHEDAAFSEDGLTLIGASNWRSRIVAEALLRSELPSLESVANSPEFRGEGEGLNYAVVRCFCVYLQERGLLSHFYRKFRGTIAADANGIATLCELLGSGSIAEVDRDFRAWVMRKNSR